MDEQQDSWNYSFGHGPGAAAAIFGLDIRMALGRTSIDDVSIGHSEPTLPKPCTGSTATRVRLMWADPVVIKEIRIDVRFRGDYPRRLDDLPVLIARADPPSLEQHNDDDIEAWLACRRAGLNLEAEHACARDFFLNLDRGSNPALLRHADQCDLAKEREALGKELHDRLILRRSKGTRFNPVNCRLLETCSDMFKRLVCNSFGGNLSSEADAFLQFAGGVLEHKCKGNPNEVVCGPNSPDLFQFAELALAALQRQVDVAFWQPRLPYLVMMQDVFIACYKSSDLPEGYYQFHLLERTPLTEQQVRLVRGQVEPRAAAEPEAHHTCNLWRAFKGFQPIL